MTVFFSSLSETDTLHMQLQTSYDKLNDKLSTFTLCWFYMYLQFQHLISLYHCTLRYYIGITPCSCPALSVDSRRIFGIQTECKSGEAQFVAGGSLCRGFFYFFYFFSLCPQTVLTFGVELLCILFSCWIYEHLTTEPALVRTIFPIWW